MSGFFGSILKDDCVADVFYGTDYHSHLGTKRAGLAFYSEKKGFQRSIHSLEEISSKATFRVLKAIAALALSVIPKLSPFWSLLTWVGLL